MQSLRARLDEPGSCLVGTWVKIPALESVELMAIAGFDYIVVDMEHAPLNLETAYRAIVVADRCGVAPLVRVPDHGHGVPQRLLDAGAAGILIPHVSTPEQARKVIRQLLFEPRGTRGMGVTSRAGQWGLKPVAEYMREGNEEVLRIPQIEDQQAVDNIEAILDVEGVNAVFVGAGDLSTSLGVAANHPDVQALMDRVLEACRARGIPCGTAVGGPEAFGLLARRGYKFVMVSNDASMLGRIATSVVKQCRESLQSASVS